MDASSIHPDAVASETVSSFVLPSAVTIAQVEELTAAITELSLAPAGTLTMDATAVEVISTPGVQLILTLQKNLQAQGQTLQLRLPDASPLTDIFIQLGLEAELAALGA